MSRDARIDAFIDRAQPFAQPILRHVRERVHAVVPAIDEAIKWGMPAFLTGRSIVLIMGAFKAHVALNFWRGQELDAVVNPDAMGQLGRVMTLDDLPPEAELNRMIAEAARLASAPRTARKPKAEPAAPPAIHPDLATALAASPAARATFESFSPSQRREYVDWVGEAKRDETRQRRIAQAIEWLSEGKRRNWKHERS